MESGFLERYCFSFLKVALSVLLEPVGTNKVVSVTSTHLKAYQTETEEEMRVKQAEKFLAKVEAWTSEATKASTTPSLWVFTGDLNSTSVSFPPPPKGGWEGKALHSFLNNGYQSAYHSYPHWEEGVCPSEVISHLLLSDFY